MGNELPPTPVTPDSGRWKPVQRGVPEETDVLTEWGWVAFEKLYQVGITGGTVSDLLGVAPELLDGFVSSCRHLGEEAGNRWGNLYGSSFSNASVLNSTLSGVRQAPNVMSVLSNKDVQSLLSLPLFGEVLPFIGNGRAIGGYGIRVDGWERYSIGAGFPRVATVNPLSGDVFFVRPLHFIWTDYQEKLVWLKMKGVDLLSSLFSDYWVKPKYGRFWKFVLGDDMVRAGQTKTGGASMNYLLLNKFELGTNGTGELVIPGIDSSVIVEPAGGWSGYQRSGQNIGLVDLYGFWQPAEFLGVELRLPAIGGVAGIGTGEAGSGLEDSVIGLSSLLRVKLDAPITVLPKKHLSRVRTWDQFSSVGDSTRTHVGLFSLVVAPYHNFIVRKSGVGTGQRMKWLGGPVVFGDGLDKSELRVAGRLGISGGGSYSILRPDYKTLRASLIRKDVTGEVSGADFGDFSDEDE